MAADSEGAGDAPGFLAGPCFPGPSSPGLKCGGLVCLPSNCEPRPPRQGLAPCAARTCHCVRRTLSPD